jgi:hypothetical protein
MNTVEKLDIDLRGRGDIDLRGRGEDLQTPMNWASTVKLL